MKPDDARKRVNRLKNQLRFCWATGTKPDMVLLKQAADQIEELQRKLEKCKNQKSLK